MVLLSRKVDTSVCLGQKCPKHSTLVLRHQHKQSYCKIRLVIHFPLDISVTTCFHPNKSMASVKTSTNADGILVRKKSNPPPQYAKTKTKTNATNSNTAVGSLLNVYTDMKESTNDATSMTSKEKKSTETTQPTSQPTQSTKPSKSSETQNGTKLWGEMLHARYLMALFDYALQHASPKKIMKCMPKAYPSSLTTEHVKSHLQKLRVKAVDNRQYQLEICDNLLQEEYDIATGKYIGETALTESTYELYSQRFAIAKEMLTDPRRFSLELLTELKQQQQPQQHVASVNNAKNSTTAMSSQSNNNNSSSSSSSSNNNITPIDISLKHSRASETEQQSSRNNKRQRRNSLKDEMAQQVQYHKRMVENHNNQLLKYSYIASQSLNGDDKKKGNNSKNAIVDAVDGLINIKT